MVDQLHSFGVMAWEFWTGKSYDDPSAGFGRSRPLWNYENRPGAKKVEVYSTIQHGDYRSKVLNKLKNLLDLCCKGDGTPWLNFSNVLKKLDEIEESLTIMANESIGFPPPYHMRKEDNLWNFLKKISKESYYPHFFYKELENLGGPIRYEDLPYFCGPNLIVLERVGIPKKDAVEIVTKFKQFATENELNSLFRVPRREIEVEPEGGRTFSGVKILKGSWKKEKREMIAIPCLLKVFDIRRKFELNDSENCMWEETFAQIRRECKEVLRLSHENVLQGYAYCFDEAEGLLYIAVERCGERLSDHLSENIGISENEKLYMLLQVAQGMAYLHSKDITLWSLSSRSVRVANREGKPILKIFSLLAPESSVREVCQLFLFLTSPFCRSSHLEWSLGNWNRCAFPIVGKLGALNHREYLPKFGSLLRIGGD